MTDKKLKRSVTISGHRTSVSLEPEFWDALAEIAAAAKRPLAQLIDEIDKRAGRGKNLSSALRIYVLAYYRAKRG
jgi:predicted DNA-binding ribbon-helix-helix protein